MMVWLAPWLIAQACPEQRGVLEFTAVTLPVGGCLLRFCLGKRLVERNFCGKHLRYLQFAALALGLGLLALIDCVIVLLYLMPRGAFGDRDWVILLGLWCIYFLLMAGAMYPGRVAWHKPGP